MKNTLLIILTLALALGSCKKEESVMEKDDKTIQKYLDSNDITTAIKDPSGVYIQHIKEGTGESPILSDNIKVKYELYNLPSDTRVPQTDDPITFKLSELILGWQIGIPYMKKGGAAYLYVPSSYAYRDGKVLKFKITLIDF
ncbi:FKBP-type peptidyl-prolyl cis-trans isomerase FkpA [Saccharicrinis carchari]|uniref:Peptidyl-prolyl cis-trans isomerase n=1 Tax=Saccharicrinis carchari TaxID=1168039 RepID=A0A521BBU0_SACCC|nr:FKBP-type peptidyl-prolyl cis-trans isomerase [Saccharicrinis carchari]SMO44553.1 FKBP-type peptidyl-prolyl cis-trans isomerase FkpA [Saccharicrinis carchari]